MFRTTISNKTGRNKKPSRTGRTGRTGRTEPNRTEPSNFETGRNRTWNRTEPNQTEPRRVRKTQAEPRRTEKMNCQTEPNRNNDFRKFRNRNESNRIDSFLMVYVQVHAVKCVSELFESLVLAIMPSLRCFLL